MQRRSHRHLLLVCAGLALALPVRLLAQDPRLSARLAPELVPQVQALVDSARTLGLPTEPLVQKALEGESKGAAGERILAAVRTLSGHLSTARQALGPDAAESDLVAGAASLRAGASPENLAELHRLRPGRSLAVPLSVLADLVATGVPVGTAWRSVRSYASEGVPDAQFNTLRDRLVDAPAGQDRTPPLRPPEPPSPSSPGSQAGESRPPQ